MCKPHKSYGNDIRHFIFLSFNPCSFQLKLVIFNFCLPCTHTHTTHIVQYIYCTVHSTFTLDTRTQWMNKKKNKQQWIREKTDSNTNILLSDTRNETKRIDVPFNKLSYERSLLSCCLLHFNLVNIYLLLKEKKKRKKIVLQSNTQFYGWFGCGKLSGDITNSTNFKNLMKPNEKFNCLKNFRLNSGN